MNPNTDAIDQPIIELANVRLRPFRATDAEALYDYLRIPIVTDRTSYPEITTALVETIIERSNHRWATGKVAKWAIAAPNNDRVIGTCGFNEWVHVHRCAELAYDLAPAYWGKGLMHDVVTALLAWVYQHTPINRIQAYVRNDNRRSARLLDRLGFTLEARLRHFRICRGEPYDFNLFSLLHSDWLDDSSSQI